MNDLAEETFEGEASISQPTAGHAGRYPPFTSFTLGAGETGNIRLDFLTADCDPATTQGGAALYGDAADLPPQ